ncbi:MAG: hypothetical protein AAGA93_28710 [Actinomycetota bacterium]
MHTTSTSPGRTNPATITRIALVAVLIAAALAFAGAAMAARHDNTIGAASPAAAPSADAAPVMSVQSEPRAAVPVELPTDGVDVAEDGTRFVFDQNGPLLDNGYPDYGNGFVTQGYLYPAGTLGETDGVLADGSPEYPDLVIGSWTCWGYFVGDGADTTDGPWVITTQVFDFDVDQPGATTIITAGMETPAGTGSIARAVTGGTGAFRNAGGQMSQETLGHNVSEGVNATFVFDLADTDTDENEENER